MWIHSTSFIVGAKLKRSEVASPADYVHSVHAFTFNALEVSIDTSLFMSEIFHLFQVLPVHTNSRKKSDSLLSIESRA